MLIFLTKCLLNRRHDEQWTMPFVGNSEVSSMRRAEGGHCPDARAVLRTRCPGWGWQTCATLSRQCLLEQVSRPFYTFRELKTCILVLVWNFARVCVAGCCPYIYIQRQGEAMYILLSWPPSLCPSFSINLQEYKDACFPNLMSLQNYARFLPMP